MDDLSILKESIATMKDVAANIPNEAKIRELAADEMKRVIDRGPEAALWAPAPKEHVKSYRNLFDRKHEGLSADGWKSFGEFLGAVSSRVGDDRMQKALREGVPSDGGFSVPTEFARQVWDASIEEQVLLPRSTVFPMGSNELKIPATVIGDHSSNLYGNVVCYWGTEGSTLTDTPPKFRQVVLNAKKLTAYALTSNEWLEDSIDGTGSITRTFSNGVSWYMDRAFLKGSGAGEPLGLLNAPCTVQAAKEGSQTADTITYTNITNMMSHLHPACWSRSFWVIHPKALGYLLDELGGNSAPISLRDAIFSFSGAGFSLMTRPVVISEKCMPLGDKGDIMLLDATQYAIGLRKEMRLDVSRDRHFDTDQTDFRLVMRVDGMPLWDEPLTLEDASTEVSPFVVLEAR